ncbi:MAG TPA: class I SAM-dependent methyltransferase [Dehalococcoidia bacterium]|nr:class I SAM-dependent methyltransferase [Dehalococcoidia bacterium]
MFARVRDAAKRSDLLVRAVRATYPALNWVRNRRWFYLRVAPCLASMEFDEVFLSGRGNEPEAHLRRTRRLRPVEGADVLVLGVGNGDELALWRREGPRSLTAVDLFSRVRWREHPGVAFARMDARRLAFADASFDIVASTALLEHVDGVDAAVSEMARVVRPGGVVFANFGPLYFTYGGAHYLGGFEHLWMRDEEFVAYLERRDIPYEREEALFYFRHGLFSRWTYRQYLECFRRHFVVDHAIVHMSPAALRFRRAHPELWRALTERYPEEDLLTFAATVWLRPRGRAERTRTVERHAVEAR